MKKASIDHVFHVAQEHHVKKKVKTIEKVSQNKYHDIPKLNEESKINHIDINKFRCKKCKEIVLKNYALESSKDGPEDCSLCILLNYCDNKWALSA